MAYLDTKRWSKFPSSQLHKPSAPQNLRHWNTKPHSEILEHIDMFRENHSSHRDCVVTPLYSQPKKFHNLHSQRLQVSPLQLVARSPYSQQNVFFLLFKGLAKLLPPCKPAPPPFSHLTPLLKLQNVLHIQSRIWFSVHLTIKMLIFFLRQSPGSIHICIPS